jgi:hypothetical protein
MARSRGLWSKAADWLGIPRLQPVVWLGLVGVLLPPGSGSPGTAVLPTAMAQVQPMAPAPAPNPFDQPLAWLADARKVHQNIRDYTCTLVKQERIGSQLQPENIIQMKFRTQPFSVYMRWLSPKQFQNQEVTYVHGRNRNKMRVHSSGALKGAVGWVSIDVNDPRVMQHSRHTIHEAGLGNIIEQMAQCWQRDRQSPKNQVRVAEYDFANRRCIRVETIRTERSRDASCYRHVIYLDKESKLPVRAEAYDWPRQGGATDGDLLEVFSFIDLRFNAGLGDEHFNR